MAGCACRWSNRQSCNDQAKYRLRAKAEEEHSQSGELMPRVMLNGRGVCCALLGVAIEKGGRGGCNRQASNWCGVVEKGQGMSGQSGSAEANRARSRVAKMELTVVDENMRVFLTS